MQAQIDKDGRVLAFGIFSCPNDGCKIVDLTPEQAAQVTALHCESNGGMAMDKSGNLVAVPMTKEAAEARATLEKRAKDRQAAMAKFAKKSAMEAADVQALFG